MKLGLLQCDDISGDLQKQQGNYPEMFETLLRQRLPDMEYHVYRVLDGVLPERPEECDVYLITGSKFGVNDGWPWIAELEAFVVQLWEAAVPLVGICFGHQVMAKALGGEVHKSPKGWGVGLSFNDVIVNKPWMQPTRDSLDLIVSHQDQVVRLPPQAEILGRSDFCPYYLLQYGEHFMSVQGHPEFCKAFSHELMDSRSDALPPARYRAGKASLSGEVDGGLMLDWIVLFLQQDR